ncbi:hypothetical protein A2311_04045 [candidate division WOR-1 bacterium RIFOXYB2_FULL_48_7]|uniref:starch synthase n=1 Tax=candidate division WOR-1 bacterium RIFOXYB2_FULL_48_7 TaxID=1802583 RepID=A0A1F4TVL1_UNCSA|nr:MAG: hypothetical protein A2311_04045 [candidate division WOR-1 bacterium RIFOXYB2_FULL_48_7]
MNTNLAARVPQAFTGKRTTRAPFVALATHEPFSNRLSGYGQAIHALGIGLTRLGVRTCAIAPFQGGKGWLETGLMGQPFSVDLPGGKAMTLQLYGPQMRDGVPYLEVRAINGGVDVDLEMTTYPGNKTRELEELFAFETYPRSGGVNNLVSNGAVYSGGELSQAALVYNLALPHVAAALQAAADKDETLILHGHDHLIALGVYLAHQQNIPTVFTVHNPAYTTLMPKNIAAALGLTAAGEVDLLALALQYCDVLTTVSPSYAEEMGSRNFAYGPTDSKYGRIIYDRIGQARRRTSGIIGILNSLLPSYLSVIPRPANRDTNVVQVLVSNRLTGQKGYDFFLETLPIALKIAEGSGLNIYFTILADGEKDIASQVAKAVSRAGFGKVSFSHYTEQALAAALAKADLALMPSRFEPCGLFAMAAQAQGVLPVVTPTGGLIDIVGRDSKTRTSKWGYFFDHPADLAKDPSLFWSTLLPIAKAVRDNSREIADLRLAAVQRAQTHYQPERSAKEYLDQVYARMVR